MSIESVMPSNHLILFSPLLLLEKGKTNHSSVLALITSLEYMYFLNLVLWFSTIFEATQYLLNICIFCPNLWLTPHNLEWCPKGNIYRKYWDVISNTLGLKEGFMDRWPSLSSIQLKNGRTKGLWAIYRAGPWQRSQYMGWPGSWVLCISVHILNSTATKRQPQYNRNALQTRASVVYEWLKRSCESVLQNDLNEMLPPRRKKALTWSKKKG